MLTDIHDARLAAGTCCIQATGHTQTHTHLIDVVQRHPISHEIFERDLTLQIHVNQLGHTVERARADTM